MAWLPPNEHTTQWNREFSCSDLLYPDLPWSLVTAESGHSHIWGKHPRSSSYVYTYYSQMCFPLRERRLLLFYGIISRLMFIRHLDKVL